MSVGLLLQIRVYHNVFKLIETRKLRALPLKEYTKDYSYSSKVTIPDSDRFDDDTVVDILSKFEFLVIKAEDLPDKIRTYPKGSKYEKFKTITYFTIVAPNSSFMNSTADYQKLMRNVDSDLKSKNRKYNVDSIVIYQYGKEQSFTAFDVTECECSTTESMKQYYQIIANPLTHVCAWPIRILNKEERKKTMDALYVKKKDLPQMFESDPTCFWLGANTGDILLEERGNENCGIRYVYHFVVKG